MKTSTTDPLTKLLAAHPFFSGIDAQHFETVLKLSTLADFEKGDFLCRECEEAKHFYLLCSGHIAIQAPSETKQAVNIQLLGPGEVVGWSWLVPPHHWRFDARATTAIEAIEIDGEGMRSACERDPRFGSEVLRRCAHILALRLEMMRIQLVKHHEK